MNKIFLDLEDTVITLFEDPHLINVEPIRNWIMSMTTVPTVHIFSFAIWNDEDKQEFQTHMKPMLEEALRVDIDEALSVEEMQRIVETWSGTRFESRLEFMQLHGKHDAFVKVCLAREQNGKCVLLDDAIPNRTVCDHDRNLQIDLLPLHVLLKQKPLFPLDNI